MGRFSRGSGDVVQPVRSVLPIYNHSGFMGLIPAYTAHEDTLCRKMVAFYRREGNLNLPSTQANVRVCSQTLETAERFAASIQGPVKVFSSAKDAVHGADLIITVTNSSKPVLFGEYRKNSQADRIPVDKKI